MGNITKNPKCFHCGKVIRAKTRIKVLSGDVKYFHEKCYIEWAEIDSLNGKRRKV